MSNPALLQAINRLDQAVTSAEGALDSLKTSEQNMSQARDAVVREALAELDGLINALQGKEHA
ncbi:MAG: hypothetical protein R3E04_01945 [Sphingobium sp.]